MEVNNGGFSQFFFNSSGDYVYEIVAALHEFGATETAKICQRAIDAFGMDIPECIEERRELIYKIEDTETEAIWNECDDAFYATGENLTMLAFNYVHNYKEYFLD